MPRIARICVEGYPRHRTQRGNNKEKTFLIMKISSFILNSFSDTKTNIMKILAYCLMGNHAHIRAIPEKETSLARGIGGTNLLYTQYINRKDNRSERLWQNRFFSSIVEEEPYLWAVIRYIEQNPVRAKLAKQAKDYQ